MSDRKSKITPEDAERLFKKAERLFKKVGNMPTLIERERERRRKKAQSISDTYDELQRDMDFLMAHYYNVNVNVLSVLKSMSMVIDIQRSKIAQLERNAKQWRA